MAERDLKVGDVLVTQKTCRITREILAFLNGGTLIQFDERRDYCRAETQRFQGRIFFAGTFRRWAATATVVRQAQEPK